MSGVARPRDLLSAPELLDLEVASVLRRHVQAGRLTPARAVIALSDLGDLPVARFSHQAPVSRCRELRENVTVDDAAEVAPAEALGCPLLTADARLAAAPGPRCEIEVLA